LNGVFFARGQNRIFRWQEGMELPELYCTLPEYPDAYWDVYERAEPEVQERLAEIVTHIAAGDGKLWGFNNFAGRIGQITEAGVEWLDIELDMTDMISIEGPERWERQRLLTYCQVVDGGFYCLRDNYSDDSWADNRTLVRFDIATGTQAQIELQYAQMLTPYKSGQFLTFGSTFDERRGESVTQFTVIDPASGKETLLPYEQITDAWSVGGLAYDEAADTIYYAYQKQIWKSEKGEPFAVVAYLTQASVHMSTPGWILAGGLYAVGAEGLYIRNVDPQFKAARALRISGGWEDMGYMRFTSQYPDIPVLVLHYYYPGAELIAQEIIGGNSETDIYVLPLRAGLRDLIDKGFTADMSESAVIVEDVQWMYPQAQAALTDSQGRVMAYPRSMDGINPWALNAPLWEMFDMGPLPTTYAQFFAYMQRWQQEFAADNPDISFLDGSYDGAGLTEVVLRNYILLHEEPGKPVDFSSPLLREALEQISQLELESYDWDTMTEGDWEAYQEQRNRPAIFSMYGRTGMFYDPNATPYFNDPERFYTSYEAYKPLLPMVFEEGQAPKLRVGMDVMIINPTSANIDLALEYIAFFAKEGVDNYARYSLRPGLNEPMERDDFAQVMQSMANWRVELVEHLQIAEGIAKRDAEDSLDYLDRWMANEEINKWEFSPGGIASYRELAEYMTFAENSFFFRQDQSGANEMLNELVARYSDGQLPLDAFLRELDNKMRMIVLEGQ
ncbi:MAG: ABC transporter substrate-binding protein, partial [Clostridia bacterium]|nr:ABC transporter substrate-binding protein [Clostridia bacterium]